MSVVNAKVAALVDEVQLAFNVGKSAGIDVGDRVEVVKDVDVDDPDSKKRLGTVRLIRLSLEVNHVQESFCVARVTDLQAQRGVLDITTVRKLKRVGIGPAARSTDATVYVEIGGAAVVRRRPIPDDTPPF